MDPGSKHSALCPPPGPPPVMLGCHGDGGPSGTSGWNLGPSYSERGDWQLRKKRRRRRITEFVKAIGGVLEMTEWWWDASFMEMNEDITSTCTEEKVLLSATFLAVHSQRVQNWMPPNRRDSWSIQVMLFANSVGCDKNRTVWTGTPSLFSAQRFFLCFLLSAETFLGIWRLMK